MIPGFLCCICRYSTPIPAYIVNVFMVYLQRMQGVPSRRMQRVRAAPGADDEWPNVRLRGANADAISDGRGVVTDVIASDAATYLVLAR